MQQTTPQTITLTNSALLKYTLFSLVFAAITLLTIILPAEYNIDPTGIGHKLGLTVFHNVKAEQSTSLSSQELTEKSIVATETIEVIVPAGRGVEYKFIMAQYQKLEYEWITDSSALYFDLHGEPEGDTTGYFESYAIATLDEMKGSFTAPFAGSHGWYWKNTSNAPVTVQLIVKGEYTKHGLK
ncbi:hypothetical protein A3Q34_01880 [Colwellia sp. PAMC 20917]|uniref:hypothetical protein n=1 Tax=Colwellia sp. PAMC 20917 TaxID=1816218 RepID=UPI0008786C3D|nr:hypothetical protein [Colwellia sp. PAMC 20917]AOW75722.1 hypothetical protein A3Q34_01880 [Colwellia sp. PAMC 20917]